MKAWQRKIREERASTGGDLFGRWWEALNTDIGRAEVREVSYDTAKAIIEEYEWLGTMPHIMLHAYGIFFDGACGGVVTYSPEYCENLGRWDQYGFTGKIILLSRGACVHWAHPHAGSKLIRASMKMLPPKYEVVTAMTDRRAGEVGTIYQACGFEYVGALRERTGLIARQPSAIIDGKLIAHRTLKQRFGTGSKAKIKELMGERVSFVEDIDKDRYFAFRGARSVVRRHRQAIAHLVKPYPKRAAGQGDSAAPADASGVRFPVAAPLVGGF